MKLKWRFIGRLWLLGGIWLSFSITGTAKTAVNVDYGKRLLEAIHFSQNVIESSAALLLNPGKFQSDTQVLVVDDERLNEDSLSRMRLSSTS